MTRIPILLDHGVEDSRNGFSVSPRAFRAQMCVISEITGAVLTMSEVAETLNQRGPVPERPVVITFDDGYADTVWAAEAFANMGLRSSAFITAGGLGAGDRITAVGVRCLADPPHVAVGPHSGSSPIERKSRAMGSPSGGRRVSSSSQVGGR